MTKLAEQDELAADAARLLALPAFPQAVREYTVSLMRFRRGSRFFNKLISHNARWRVAAYLFYLHADRERFGPDGGATYSNLRDMCSRRAEVSPRVLKTVLALLQLTGFVKTTRSATDRRSKFYQPTERMDGFVQQWLGYGTRALDVLEPGMRRAQMLRDDPGFADRFLVSSGRAHLTAIPLVERMPEFVAFFGARDGAGAVLLAIMLADIDGTPVPSRAELAKTFGLSKTQVTNVLIAGEALGYFALDPAGVPAAIQHLRDSFGRWVSFELAFYARHMQPA
jgi:DNA-binding MarR family transcriptional regulator